MKTVAAFAGALLLAAPVGAFAANADHPYSNIDHRIDAGNNTGDSQVDRLNQGQLDTNGSPGRTFLPRGYAQPQAYYPGQGGYAPQGYYAPQPSNDGW